MCDFPEFASVGGWARDVKDIAEQLFPELPWGVVYGLVQEGREDPRPDLNGHSVRDLLRDIGMLGRKYDPDIWVAKTVRRAESAPCRSNILIDGTRFTNEVAAVDEVWWCLGGTPPDDHASEALTLEGIRATGVPLRVIDPRTVELADLRP